MSTPPVNREFRINILGRCDRAGALDKTGHYLRFDVTSIETGEVRLTGVIYHDVARNVRDDISVALAEIDGLKARKDELDVPIKEAWKEDSP